MTNNNNTVFFGGLKQNVTNDNVQQWTEMFGQVSNIRIILNKKNPNGLNVAFVEMESDETAQACIEYYKKNPLEVEGITLTISYPKNPTRHTAESNNRSGRNFDRPRNNTYRSERRYESRDDQNGLFEYESKQSRYTASHRDRVYSSDFRTKPKRSAGERNRMHREW